MDCWLSHSNKLYLRTHAISLEIHILGHSARVVLLSSSNAVRGRRLYLEQQQSCLWLVEADGLRE